ncbi:MAG TPA: ATP-binding protein [Kofleriaceae bacterium]
MISSLRTFGTEYQLLAETLPQLIWVADADGSVEYVNQRYIDYTGYVRDELCGMSEWRKALHPDDLVRCLRDWETAMATGTGFETEYRLLRASDSTWRWHLTRACPVTDEHGRVARWFGTCTDIEDQKRIQESLRISEERLREESRRKDELLAMLGHELRNPLTPILTAVRLLKERGPERAEHTIDIIDRQTRHVARLLDDLFDLARINRNRIELHKDIFEIQTAVAAATETVMPLIEQRGHTLIVDVPREGLAVEADPVRIAQVISNLMHNAAKYTEPGGFVTIRAVRDHDEVVLSVTDTGAGIDAEVLPHVFDLFVQGQRSLARSEGGLGIGLTVVRSLVELHGGSVAAHSNGPGRGSEFIVRIPAVASVRAIPQQGLSDLDARSDVRAHHGRILIVDDNADIADVLRDYLSWKGFEVYVASDGASALEAAREVIPEVVLLDIGLPKVDGYEVARRLRLDPRFANTRLIALTGYGQRSDRERASQSGFDEHLVKPPDFNELLRMLTTPT